MIKKLLSWLLLSLLSLSYANENTSNKIGMGESVVLENLRIKLDSVSINKVNFETMDYENVVEDVLCINLKIKNISKGQIFAPIWFGTEHGRRSFYVDEFNNKHVHASRLDSDLVIMDIDPFKSGLELYPSQEMDVCCPFETIKLDNSSKFIATIYLQVNNADKHDFFNLTFDKDDFK